VRPTFIHRFSGSGAEGLPMVALSGGMGSWMESSDIKPGFFMKDDPDEC
jgi:hypothetical protein